MRVAIIGSGYVGSYLASQLSSQPGYQVWTLRRHPEPSDPNSMTGDITHVDGFQLPAQLTHVIICVGLKGAAEAEYSRLFINGIGNLLQRLEGHPIERVLFTSTTGVYAESAGGWVTEDSPVQPSRISTRYYLAAEEQILNSPYPAVVARLSGIYGPERTRMIQALQTSEPDRIDDEERVVNQIHRNDAAGALAHLITIPQPEPIYNVTDTEPVTRGTLKAWFKQQCGNTAAQTKRPVPSSRARAGNKRVSCQRLLDSGFLHEFPTYREGYASL